jgi:hypothetical protein
LQTSLCTTVTEHDRKNKSIRVETRVRVVIVLCANATNEDVNT